MRGGRAILQPEATNKKCFGGRLSIQRWVGVYVPPWTWDAPRPPRRGRPRANAAVRNPRVRPSESVALSLLLDRAILRSRRHHHFENEFGGSHGQGRSRASAGTTPPRRQAVRVSLGDTACEPLRPQPPPPPLAPAPTHRLHQIGIRSQCLSFPEPCPPRTDFLPCAYASPRHRPWRMQRTLLRGMVMRPASRGAYQFSRTEADTFRVALRGWAEARATGAANALVLPAKALERAARTATQGAEVMAAMTLNGGGV